VLGVVALILFYTSVLTALMRSKVPAVVFVTAAVLWSLIYSMGDNTQVLNDLHSAPVLALMIGFSARRAHD
jgi:hypothetical protein